MKDLKITILSTMMTQVGVGEWGFSALVEADGHRILFDTGLRPDTVLQNALSMRIDLSDVEEVVLSHNHGDHTGGLVNLRKELVSANERAMQVAHVGSGIFWERPGSNPQWSMAPKKVAYEAAGGRFIVHDQAVEIHPGIWLTGPVPRRHPEKNYGLKVDDEHKVGKVQSPDGLINTLDYATEITGTENVHAAIGGFHMLQASDAGLEWTAEKLVDLEVGNFVGAHCTGLEPVYRIRDLAHLDRLTAVVGATGASFTLSDGIEPLSLAR